MTNVEPFGIIKEDCRQIFEKKMKWWLLSCQWSGLYLGNSRSSSSSDKRKWLNRVWKAISCLVFMYILAYTSFLAYRYHFKTFFTSGWIKSFNLLIWSSAIAVWLLSVMIGFGRGNLFSWCHEVSEYCDDYGLNEKIVVLLKRIPRSVIRNIVFNIILTGGVWALYDLAMGLGENMYAFPNEMRISNVTAFFILVFLQNYTFSNFNPIVEICSNLVSYEMDRVNKEFAACCEGKKVSKTTASTINVKNIGTDVSMQLDNAMEQHSRICDLINSFNKCLYHYAAASFLLGLPVSCFAFYLLLTVAKNTVDVVITAMTMVTFLTPIISNCILGCFVNYKAHEALDYIWKIPTEGLRESTMRNLYQLTARLTGTSIGYTVYGFFTFTMPAVLSIIGCILTYFIVVIQFKPPEQTDCTSVCNNSLPAWCGTNQTGLV